MIRALLLIAFLLGLAAPLGAQTPRIWAEQGDRLRLESARISVPRRAASVTLTETAEFSRKGEGLDNSVQYKSADRKVWATVYLYLPGVAHSGLAALATAEALRLNSETPVRPLGSRIVSAGGAEGVAIRSDFSGYLGDHRSSAAFVKAGRWMLKFRVTGPEARAAEVDSVMAALLDAVRFEGEAKPYPAELIEPAPCPPSNGPDAALRPDDAALITRQTIVLAGFDPVVERRTADGGEASRVSRFGSRWCRGIADTGSARVPFLRALDGEEEGIAKSVLLVLYSDAGGLLEAVRMKEAGVHVLLNHGIGHSWVLGTLDRPPNDRQIVRYLSQQDEALRTRATVVVKPNGGTEVTLPPPDPTI